MATSLVENKTKVQKLIHQGKKEHAVTLLLKMVETSARARQFKQADHLREQIIKVNSMALNEIINAAEIIEAEKAKAIDQYHKRVWAPIYGQLTALEANDFYFSLKKIKLGPDKMIIQQGRVNNRLFFVDLGILRILFEKKNSQIFLKETGKGEPVGFKSFFSISYATVTVTTKEPVTLHYLERKEWERLVEKHPGLDGKIESLCHQLIKGKIEDILTKKSAERRQNERFRATGKVSVTILNPDGMPAQTPFYGTLEDISQGGLSFSFHKSAKKTARMLLGQRAHIQIKTDKDQGGMSRAGRIIGVHNQLFDNYLVSFKFHKPVPHHEVMNLVIPDKI